MKAARNLLNILLSLSLASLVHLGGAAVAAPLPAEAVPMSPDELSELYRGKTQLWREGIGGYFYASDNKLAGYSRKRVETYAVGRWYVTDAGEVCVVERWIWGPGRQGRGPMKRTCWEHRKFGGQIWKYDNGWYQWNRADGEASRFIKGYKYYDQVMALHARLR